jgi:acetolactate synthase I/II/III large subunit
MIKLSDYVIDFLVKKGIHDIFLVSGGGIMHLIDSVGRNKNIKYYCNHHEQACAIAAEGYARVQNKIGACLVTTGPGGFNAISGIVGAWVDSIPLIVISGQVRRNLIADYNLIRQKGPQEGNVVEVAKHVTKYAKVILEPEKIRYELELAYYQATTGRPGPVWLDIPLDVQDTMIDEELLEGYQTEHSEKTKLTNDITGTIQKILNHLSSSKRPLIIAGTGIHLSNSEHEFSLLLDKLKMPVILPYTAKDLVPEDHPLNMGVFGGIGQRRANFALQNSDCLLSIGVGLSCSKVGFNFNGFAPKAKKIIVDIDKGQLYDQVIKPDIPVHLDVKTFLLGMLSGSKDMCFTPNDIWSSACNAWKEKYPLVIPDFYKDKEHVNTYVFMDKLSNLLIGDDVLLTGDGMDCVSYFQAFRVKLGQRTMNNGNWGSMGWDLPASVGACIGSGKKRTICITGDGSIQLNIQELLTISFNHLPVKIFIFNNKGYSSIRATQRSLFDGRFVGADKTSGIGTQNFEKFAESFNIEYGYIKTNEEIDFVVRKILQSDGPSICEINVSSDQEIIPKASAFRKEDGTLESRPLEDMYPFLPRDEVNFNMTQFD